MDAIIGSPAGKWTKYERHLSSRRWKEGVARVAEILASGNACRLCTTVGTPEEPLQGHHRTYANFGDERIGDVTALCRRCHEGVTSMLRARRYAEEPVAPPSISVESNRAPLFDQSIATGIP